MWEVAIARILVFLFVAVEQIYPHVIGQRQALTVGQSAYFS